MENLKDKEVQVFFMCMISGICSGVMFDIFRIIRSSMGDKAKITNLCDSLFWTFYTSFFVWWIFKINDGELRWFVFAGIFMGAAVYFVMFSRFFLPAGKFALHVLLKIFGLIIKIILLPVKFFLRKTKCALVFVSSPLRKFNKKIRVIKRFILTKIRVRSFCAKKI